MNRAMKRKIEKAVLLIVLQVMAAPLYAQSEAMKGKNALDAAKNALTGYFEPAQQLVFAISAILGLIGAIKVYNKFSNGDPDTGKTAASWFGACLFLVLAGTVLKAFFATK